MSKLLTQSLTHFFKLSPLFLSFHSLEFDAGKRRVGSRRWNLRHFRKLTGMLADKLRFSIIFG